MAAGSPETLCLSAWNVERADKPYPDVQPPTVRKDLEHELGRRDEQSDTCALARSTFDLNAASVALHDAAHLRQPDTKATALGCVKRLADLRELLGTHPWAAVSNCEHHFAAISYWATVYRQRTALVHRLQRIGNQAMQDLTEHQCIGAYGWYRVRQFGGVSDAAARHLARELMQTTGDEGLNVYPLRG